MRAFVASLAFATFLFIFLFVFGPYIVLHMRYLRWSGERNGTRNTAEYRRRWVQDFQNPWVRRILFLFRFLMRAKVQFDLQAGKQVAGKSVIVESNHRHTLDTILVQSALSRLGIDSMWVIKDDLVKELPWGDLMRAVKLVFTQGKKAALQAIKGKTLELWIFMLEAGFIPIDRSAGKESMKKIAEGAKRAHDEGFSVMIFPEGSRGPLRNPKPGGFTTIVEHMPGRPILSVSVYWEMKQGSGKDLFSGAAFFGCTIEVRAEVWGHDAVSKDPAAWLEETYQRKGARFGTPPKAKAPPRLVTQSISP